jgi:hypothetical protein
MNDWLNLFSGDLVIARGDVSKALDRLAPAMTFEEATEMRQWLAPGATCYRCTRSPLDARLAKMEEFRHGR